MIQFCAVLRKHVCVVVKSGGMGCVSPLLWLMNEKMSPQFIGSVWRLQNLLSSIMYTYIAVCVI